MAELTKAAATRDTCELNDEARAIRKREVALGYRLFAAYGWGDLGDGHISARDPEHTDCFWLLRGGVPFCSASVADLVLIGPDGQVVGGSSSFERSAYYIHHPIHEARPDVTCVAHVHTDWGTPFAAEARPILPITQESCLFFESHALFDDEEVQIQDTDGGRRIAACLGPHSAVILRGHGLLTAAETVAEAIGLFAYMERAAEAQLKAPNAKPIASESALYAKQDLLRIESARCCFDSMVQCQIGDPSAVD